MPILKSLEGVIVCVYLQDGYHYDSQSHQLGVIM